MNKSIIILAIACMWCSACQQKKGNFSEEMTDILLKESDTTFVVDDQGRTLKVISEAKIQAIDNSINGRVKYRYQLFNGEFGYDRFRNKQRTVFKEEFFKKDRRIYINDDSLRVGELFNGSVWINKPSYRIEINEPAETVIIIDHGNGSGDFEFLCNETGVFNFKGRILYDSTESLPFEYKFIVN